MKKFILYTRMMDGKRQFFIQTKGDDRENPEDIHPNPWTNRGEFERYSDIFAFLVQNKD